jgi:CRP/FNR family transcriptional regulator, cyclic AMP receptor protein
MSRTNNGAHGAWESLTGSRSIESYGRGRPIYAPGEPAHSLFVVVTGQVGLNLRSPEGRPLTLRVVEAGGVIGHAAMTPDSQYDTHADTATPAQLVRVPADEAAQLVEREPALGLALLEDLARHKGIVSHRIDEVVFKSVPARLASLLLDMARHHDGPHAPQVPRRSHRQLAEQINAYRETVTKVLNEFRDARLLEIERHTIMLLNLRRLEELAQG